MSVQTETSSDFTCNKPYIIDGDTFSCGRQRVRLMNIDAPEMPGHCRAGRKCTKGDPHAARQYLIQITRAKLQCVSFGEDSYGRTLATCQSGGIDLSCAMVDAGHAVQRYGTLHCP